MNIAVKAAKDDLEDRIITASESYYLAEPIMSDEQFDALVEELRSVYPGSVVLKKVGWGLSVYAEKIKLPEPIRHSLDKVQSYESLVESSYTGSWKIDGMSCILQYDKGVLKLAATRGDGEYGVNILPKTPYIKGIPQQLEHEADIIVRGEIFISLPTFAEHLADEYSNPRASAAGIVNRKSFEGLEYIEFVLHPECRLPYFEACAHASPDGKLPTVFKEDFKRLPERDMFPPYEETFPEFYKCNHYYPTDGMVCSDFKHDDIFAFKFETEKVRTKVTHVEYNLKKGGKLVPTVHYSPVRLYDTTCVKCSGHNFKYIKDNNIGNGTEIELTKANEIIPYITNVISGTTADLPDVPYKEEGAHAFVDEDIQYELSLKHFIEHHFCFDGFKRPEVIIEALGITTFKELAGWRNPAYYSVIVDKLSEQGVKKIAPKIADRLTEGPLNEKDFFQQFGYDGLGNKAAEALQPYIERYYQCFTGNYNPYYSHTLEVNNIIDQTNVNITVSRILHSQDYKELVEDARTLFDWHYKETAPVVAEGEVKNTFIITGGLPSGRTKKQFAEYVAQYGYKMVTTSKQADITITSSLTSTTAKAKYARDNDRPLLTEDQFLERYLGQ